MRLMGKKALAVSILLAAVSSNAVWAEDTALQQRVERLERIIQGQGLVSLLARVDQLQNEIQSLKGENESLTHQLGKLKASQREMYIDLENRMTAQAVAVQVPTTVETIEPKVIQTPVVESSTDTETAAEPESVAVPVAVENGEAAYQAALQTLRSGQYEQAASALYAFPEQYPQSSYLPNAYYWQGEANYVLRNFEKAIAAFQTVIDRFPGSSKVADATLKQGFSQYELGQVEIAKATLTNVMQQYPNTSAARLAKVRLERIKQQSN
ncbi:tol-pal system protein YbgF [Methylophaga sp. 42_8_T64]|nr:tol-pal system protein YbgF [Methylophaga sp. 41_12_T18]OUR88313.1 tol-pal system protein YbgF [Methylophaga sp. 42_8_T64]